MFRINSNSNSVPNSVSIPNTGVNGALRESCFSQRLCSFDRSKIYLMGSVSNELTRFQLENSIAPNVVTVANLVNFLNEGGFSHVTDCLQVAFLIPQFTCKCSHLAKCHCKLFINCELAECRRLASLQNVAIARWPQTKQKPKIDNRSS